MNKEYWIAQLQELIDQIDGDVFKNKQPYCPQRVLRINTRIKAIIEELKG
ncbi:MAG: hypothetical protein KAS32_15740 [Candidatus Peribacteraceae bacterium]|nr:hypothetical protein [Candidatus Peribacteraceae bacterium]